MSLISLRPCYTVYMPLASSLTPHTFSSSTPPPLLLLLLSCRTRLVIEGCDRHANVVLGLNNMLEIRGLGRARGSSRVKAGW